MLRGLKSGTRAEAAPWVTTATQPEGIPSPERIIDAAALRQKLDAAAEAAGDQPTRSRPAVLALVRDALKSGREEIRDRFQKGKTGGDACVIEQSFLMDQIVQAMADVTNNRFYAAPNPTSADRLALIATGGYGRGELAPHSDIDLLFLLPYKRTPRVEQFIEFILYLLWDLGLKVGHAARSIDESIRGAREDLTIRTTLLECRLIWGDRRLMDDFRKRYQKDVIAGNGPAYIAAKLEEREQRHRKLGDSRYVLEPNIKEGKGGLRDLHTLFWIGRYLYHASSIAGLVEHGTLTEAEARRCAKAQGYLRTLRCHLHYLTDRPEERLTFDVQPEIARRMGYKQRSGSSPVERFMKHYFITARTIGDLTRIICAALEAEHHHRSGRGWMFFLRGQKSLDGFPIVNGRLGMAEETQFEDRPSEMIRLFHVGQEHGLDIHPTAYKQIHRSLHLIDQTLRQDAEANRLFMDILAGGRDPELALRRMNEAGVLGRFIPDFGWVVAQMQYDMYHVFTVDEHTLFALGILHRLETGALSEAYPEPTHVLTKVQSRRSLYVALMLHDIAKGRGGDHSVLGSRVARRLCPRLGLDAEETETVEWLVRYHLILSRSALKRDIDDEKTVLDMITVVNSPERLRLLYVLTVIDISAVGPGRWTAWKGNLLSQLFNRAMEHLSGGFEGLGRERRVAAAQEAVREALPSWPREDIDAFLSKGYTPYWLSLDLDTHLYHASIVRQADLDKRPLTVETRIDRAGAVTEVTVYATDHPGLFSRLAGALAVAGANIVEAKIFTLTNGMALDIFSVQDAVTGAALEAGDKLARLSFLIGNSLSGEIRPYEELAKRRPAFASRTHVFRVEPRVLIDNQASNTHTVIEINGRDRPGLLYDVTHALTTLSLQISSAKIATYGERAVDVFYVKDVFGLKITHDIKIEQIRRALREALEPGGLNAEKKDGDRQSAEGTESPPADAAQ